MRIVKFILLVIVALTSPSAPSVADHRIGHIIVKTPDLTVRSAYASYRPQRGDPDPEWAENTLRVFTLREAAEVVARNLDWVRKSDWDAEFKAMFERAVTWVREVRAKTPEEIYSLSHELSARPDAEAKRYDGVASRLLTIAADRGHEKAKAEKAASLKRFRARKRRWPPRMHALLMEYVQKGDPGAMDLLSSRYKNGEDLERNLAKAYYWLLRAQEGGEDEASGLRVLDRRISPADKEQALKWFREGTVPPL